MKQTGISAFLVQVPAVTFLQRMKQVSTSLCNIFPKRLQVTAYQHVQRMVLAYPVLALVKMDGPESTAHNQWWHSQMV